VTAGKSVVDLGVIVSRRLIGTHAVSPSFIATAWATLVLIPCPISSPEWLRHTEPSSLIDTFDEKEKRRK
jgi:hypothetical protein